MFPLVAIKITRGIDSCVPSNLVRLFTAWCGGKDSNPRPSLGPTCGRTLGDALPSELPPQNSITLRRFSIQNGTRDKVMAYYFAFQTMRL